ncbi:hypothetical protein RWE15_04810 [Virgibacillus halophilus]|uniref:Uncharacterized protein n=1 Tax=Tigheibacillus halophilus TaxID=361280 RepID=A0ABU5C5D8_9BACI|nr:hypothetical protein [Virgibacillus halophilus]
MIHRRKQPKSTAATVMNVLWKVVALGYLMFWTVYWLNVPTEATFTDETDTNMTLKAAEHFDSEAKEEEKEKEDDADESDKKS